MMNTSTAHHHLEWDKYGHYIKIVLGAFIAVLLTAGVVSAQEAQVDAESLSLSITPPLVQLSIGKGEFWASSLRVLNTNDYPITVYGSVTDFRPSGNEGQGVFVPQNTTRPNSLSTWARVSEEPITIPPGGSGSMPFEVSIPEDADSGGHYAAILVGTRPVEDDGEGSLLRVSSFVSSLLFVRIEGDVHEDGFISSFHSEKELYETPDISFTLKFKNTGNVHVRPEGEINIETIRGRTIATLPFNDSGAYGSVLPEGVREFEVPWNWEDVQWYNIGRYRAVATVAFGEDARHNVSATTTFWYMPRQPLLWVGGSVALFALVLFLFVRISVARAVRGSRRRVRRRRMPRQRVPKKKALKRVSETPAPQKQANYPHQGNRQDIVLNDPKSGKSGLVDLRKQKDK